MPPKGKEVTKAVAEAERLLSVVTGQSFGRLEELPDAEYERILRLGTRALLLQSISKAQLAMEAISEENLKEASVMEKATVAGILADKAEKLARLVPGKESPDEPGTYEAFSKLEALIEGRVATLKAFGVEVKLDNTQSTSNPLISPKEVRDAQGESD